MPRGTSDGAAKPFFVAEGSRRVTAGARFSIRSEEGSPMELRPLGEALGTEARGIDLSKPLDDATFASIERAFAEHPVLVFREQRIGAAELAAFGRRFGEPRKHALVGYRYPGHPEVTWLRNVDDGGDIDLDRAKRR